MIYHVNNNDDYNVKQIRSDKEKCWLDFIRRTDDKQTITKKETIDLLYDLQINFLRCNIYNFLRTTYFSSFPILFIFVKIDETPTPTLKYAGNPTPGVIPNSILV